jgi:8-oxo-dGTP pyrophosphatase MutT (NUDIX family)
VLLTQKIHVPDNDVGRTMLGKLNGIGGKCEAGEDVNAAIQREGKEETFGVIDAPWQPFCAMWAPGEWACDCFRIFVPRQQLWSVPRLNDVGEAMRVMHVEELLHQQYAHDRDSDDPDVMLNLRWLLPMALELDCRASVEYRAGKRGDR